MQHLFFFVHLHAKNNLFHLKPKLNMHSICQHECKQYAHNRNTANAFQATMEQPSQTVVHAKLEMTNPDSQEEAEADAAANDIVQDGKIARSILAGSSDGGMAVSSQMEGRLNSLQGGGQVMPDGLRNMMERGFNRDFSQVRLHTDGEAASLSSSIHAKAFTHGNDIYFNQGQFSPNTPEGQKLMAHELTHVVQGGGKIAREHILPDGAAVDFSNRFYEYRDCFDSFDLIKPSNMISATEYEKLNKDVLMFSGHQYTQCGSGGGEWIFSNDLNKTRDWFNLNQIGDHVLDNVKMIISTSCATLSEKNSGLLSHCFPNLKLQLGFIHTAPSNYSRNLKRFFRKLKKAKKHFDLENKEDIDYIMKAWFGSTSSNKNLGAIKVNDDKENKYTRYKKVKNGTYKIMEEPDAVHYHDCVFPDSDDFNGEFHMTTDW